MVRAITALNGRLPLAALTVVGRNTNDGTVAYLRSDAAASYARMLTKGLPPTGITTSYRSLEAQQSMWTAYLAGRLKATAARPGRSWHGEGLALDLAVRQYTWIAAHGGEHGWSRPLLHATSPEPWHCEYDPDEDQHAYIAPTPAPAQEDEEMPLTSAEMDEIAERTAARVWATILKDGNLSAAAGQILTGARLDDHSDTIAAKVWGHELPVLDGVGPAAARDWLRSVRVLMGALLSKGS